MAKIDTQALADSAFFCIFKEANPYSGRKLSEVVSEFERRCKSLSKAGIATNSTFGHRKEPSKFEDESFSAENLENSSMDQSISEDFNNIMKNAWILSMIAKVSEAECVHIADYTEKARNCYELVSNCPPQPLPSIGAAEFIVLLDQASAAAIQNAQNLLEAVEKTFKENAYKEHLCLKCMRRPAAYLSFPCHHACLCESCMEEAMKCDAAYNRCFNCHERVEEIWRLSYPQK